jgi:hypothetical protein
VTFRSRPLGLWAAALAVALLPSAGPIDPSGQDWIEADPDEDLLPGDLGGGTEDLAAESYFSPRRTRRVPLSVSAIILLLTLTSGIGMAAGLLAGPSPWFTGHGAGGLGAGTPSRPVPTPNGTYVPPANSTIPHPSNTTSSPNGSKSPQNGTKGSANGTGNSTGNGTGSGNTSQNGSSPGNSTGNRTGPVGGSNGTLSGGGNRTRAGTTNRSVSRNGSVIIYRGRLPWLPTDSRFLLLAGAAAALVGLAVAVLFESFRPPPSEGNPWRGDEAPRRRVRRRPPRISPDQAIDLAVRRLREQLLAYHRRAGAGGDLEVRERIIELYGTLLGALRPGLGDLDGRTPREVEWLSVRYLGVRPPTAHELTWLFEEARYSSHPLPSAGIARAERALDEFVADLEIQRLVAS